MADISVIGTSSESLGHLNQYVRQADDIHQSPDPTQGSFFYTTYGKPALDLVFGSMIFLFVAPVILILAAIIYMEGGKPFFSQNRVGLWGRQFRCIKLRTMAVDAEDRIKRLLSEDPGAAAEWAETQKLRNDPRITRIGKFLRKTSLDELPQIVNVLRGEMSLVGPRPVVPDELARYGIHQSSYMRLRPGITGAWQTSGRNDVSYENRVRMDVEYGRNMSIVKDVSIIVGTLKLIFNGNGH